MINTDVPVIFVPLYKSIKQKNVHGSAEKNNQKTTLAAASKEKVLTTLSTPQSKKQQKTGKKNKKAKLKNKSSKLPPTLRLWRTSRIILRDASPMLLRMSGKKN